jgi:hypothetical protein
MQNLFYLTKEFKFQLKLLYTDYQFEYANTDDYNRDYDIDRENIHRRFEQQERCCNLRDAIDEIIVGDFINNHQKYNRVINTYDSPKNVYVSTQVRSHPTRIVALGVRSEMEARRMMVHDIMIANMKDFSGCYCSELTNWKKDICDVHDDAQVRRFAELLGITPLVDSSTKMVSKTISDYRHPFYEILHYCSLPLYVAFLGKVEVLKHRTIAISCLDG